MGTLYDEQRLIAHEQSLKQYSSNLCGNTQWPPTSNTDLLLQILKEIKEIKCKLAMQG